MIQSGLCKIFHPQKGLIIQAEMTTNRMFIMTPETYIRCDSCFNANTADASYLWHCRYAHIGYKGFELLQNKEMVNGLPKLKQIDIFCTNYLKGKQH